MSDEDIESTSSAASSQERHSDREFTSLLLSLYQEAPELWKVKSKHYFDKNKKALAIKKITNALKVLNKNFTEEDFKKKINKLRTSFNREVKKKKESMKSGSGADEVYVPKLWYFNEMTFLLDSADIAATQSSVDFQDSSADTSDNHREIDSNRQKKKKKTDDIQAELLNLATSYFGNKEEDEFDVMGKGWAIQMRQLRADQKIFARKIINDVLFEGTMGTLTRHGVSFLPDVPSGSPVYISDNSYSSDSTYTSPIQPRSPVPNTCSTSNNPVINTSSPETSQIPISDQSPDLTSTMYEYTLIPVKSSPATNTPNSYKSPVANTSSGSDHESSNFLNRVQRYTPRQSSARTSSLKNSTSPRSTILRKAFMERYTSSALNNESQKYSSSCQLNEDCISTGEDNDLVRPEDLNLSTISEVEETMTAADYVNNFSNL